MPRLQSAVPRSVRCVGSEDPEELIQDGTAMAARMLVSAEINGKHVTAGNIAYYTLQHLKSGRRTVGYSKVDVYGSATRLSGRSSVGCMEEELGMVGEGAAPITLQNLLSVEEEDPAVQATRKLDWELFMVRLDDRARTMIQWLAEGRTLSSLANKWRISHSRVMQLKGKLLIQLREFFGAEMWLVLAAQPQWRNNLSATRERMACRYARGCPA